MAKTQNGLELDAGERIEFSDLTTQNTAAYTKTESNGLYIAKSSNSNKLIYYDNSGDAQELSLGSDGQVLTSTGATTAPAFEDPTVASHTMTGGNHSASPYKLFYANGSGSIIELGYGASGTVLTSNGTSSDPSFQAVGGGSATDMELDSTPNANSYSGIWTYATVDVNSYGFGCLLHMDSDGHYIMADADNMTTMPCTAVALETGTGTKKVLLLGFVYKTGWSFTKGNRLNVSDTAGQIAQQTLPSYVQQIGVVFDTSTIFFNPSMTILDYTPT